MVRLGWQREHTSKSDGRNSSYYLINPAYPGVCARLSNHALTDAGFAGGYLPAVQRGRHTLDFVVPDDHCLRDWPARQAARAISFAGAAQHFARR